MEPLVLASVAFIQTWTATVRTVGIPGIEEHASLIEDYNLSIQVLEHCAGIVKSKGEDLVTPVLAKAFQRCTQIGEYLAYRQERLRGPGTRKRISFLLAPWDKLQAKNKEFSDKVRLVHELTQEFVTSAF
jgi:hypothetical protein